MFTFALVNVRLWFAVELVFDLNEYKEVDDGMRDVCVERLLLNVSPFDSRLCSIKKLLLTLAFVEDLQLDSFSSSISSTPDRFVIVFEA